MSAQATGGTSKRKPGCLPVLMYLLLAGLACVMALDALLAPWIYVVGGRTRWLPVWQGIGEAHTASGTFKVFIWFSPSSVSSRILPSTSISGSGYVCTPLGQRYPLRVAGGASGKIWKDMDGHAFIVSAYNRPALWRIRGGAQSDWRPSLRFSGHWAGPNLEMTDEGSLARAFMADGALNIGVLPGNKANAVAITFLESNWWLGGASCQ